MYDDLCVNIAGKLDNRIGIFPISFVEMNSSAKALMKLSSFSAPGTSRTAPPTPSLESLTNKITATAVVGNEATNTSSSISTSTSKINEKDKKSMKRYKRHIKKFDISYVIPLNVEKHIVTLEDRIKKYENINDYPINNYFKI